MCSLAMLMRSKILTSTRPPMRRTRTSRRSLSASVASSRVSRWRSRMLVRAALLTTEQLADLAAGHHPAPAHLLRPRKGAAGQQVVDLSAFPADRLGDGPSPPNQFVVRHISLRSNHL